MSFKFVFCMISIVFCMGTAIAGGRISCARSVATTPSIKAPVQRELPIETQPAPQAHPELIIHAPEQVENQNPVPQLTSPINRLAEQNAVPDSPSFETTAALIISCSPGRSSSSCSSGRRSPRSSSQSLLPSADEIDTRAVIEALETQLAALKKAMAEQGE